MFVWAVARQYFPAHLDTFLTQYTTKLVGLFYPYVEITFPEYAGDRLKRSEAYAAVEAYLGSSCAERANRLKAEADGDGAGLVLSMDEYEELADDFGGATLWWSSHKTSSVAAFFSLFPRPDECRSYCLAFHRRHRQLVHTAYLHHVMKEGKALEVRRRRRKLYTNNHGYDRYFRTMWSHVAFEHPATFDTLAMDADRKREIMEDLLAFSKGKDFYAKIGKPWKRGYLLYGPPGTGKSTMVAAMANLLDYDVYDLELTAVRNNAALRKLLVETTSKSVIVVEDIDCSQQLSSRRNNNRKKNKKKKRKDLEEEEYSEDGEKEEEIGSEVTLSGFLNFIDGLWSACGGERIIVFTTNHVERLDPGLIRRGRMDVHVELSYCTFEGFKVLARNYLGVEAHRKFARVRELVGERAMTPADVAECLMPRSVGSGADADERVVEGSLARLIRALERRKRNRNGEESVGNRNGDICEKGGQRNEPECCTWM
ncbi:AAA-ATPase At3g28580-like [Ananas comosus]|uniref:AAA-ATPase At3g28580-like n=1 Tax=Ananas comosus TaxID=4615 RepID=A0A6P5G930_ANACO|nr:AAA-ATPase At3g28580-like [Ananas comosus]